LNIVYFLREYTRTSYIDSFAHNRILGKRYTVNIGLGTLVTSFQTDEPKGSYEVAFLSE
jgi:hypothetical protein